MTIKNFKIVQLLPAALVILSAAAFAFAQQPSGNKHNTRPEVLGPASSDSSNKAIAHYSYEFTQPEFFVRRILIEHDAAGRGTISFEKRNEETPVTEPLDLSPATISRISALWEMLRFLESKEDYQADREYPHLGTMRLKMEQGTLNRTAEFNWTNHKDATSLVNEYRRVADQAMLLFDISVSRESQPLNAPKLMERFELLLKRNGLSDPKQLLPLLKEISTDEYLPLIARNHALRLIKKIEK
ncbi:MAG: hypothetical protein AABN95_06070 [Acidobacteriota bacterium]